MTLRAHAIRLGDSEQLYGAINALVIREQIRAGFVVAAVGMLRAVRLRMPSTPEKPSVIERAGPHQILALSGFVSVNHSHLHMMVAGENGIAWGGHLLAGGNITQGVVEIGVLADDRLVFSREHDSATGYEELVVSCTGLQG